MSARVGANVVYTRRATLRCAVGLFAAACARPPRAAAPSDAFTAIEAAVGGRVGVFAVDVATGRELEHRPDERFAMCSTFKLPLAAVVLARVDRAELSLDERVAYGPADLLEHAPVTRAHLADGAMTVAALAEAAVTTSDNTAANLLLARVGGAAGLTAFVRALGDPVTRLDRDEPSLNENAPGDPRDTTSPRAMAKLALRVVCGDALSPARRALLSGWLRACATGKDRLRAGLPRDWPAGDKTGTGRRGAANDVAVAWPPGRAPVVVAAYLSDGGADLAALAAAHARIGTIVAQELGA